MSDAELDRLHIIKKLVAKELTQPEAAELLSLSVRQIKRLVRQYKGEGSLGIKSRNNGGNRAFPVAFKSSVMEAVKSSYQDFGPSFAAEKLAQRESLHVNRETLRQWMRADGHWQAKTRKQAHIHQSRERRVCRGELVQIDGSHHDWFEGRAPKCCLLVFIDDATSTILQMRFEPTETMMGYFRCAKDYFAAYGLPVAFYSDKAAVFSVNTPASVQALSQFGRAMQELKVELILAHSPQAKGRVERANRTLQDRLIKEMRLRNICSIDAANRYLPQFIADHNARFAVTPSDERDAHRALQRSQKLDHILSHQETRKLTKNLEFSYHNSIYQLTKMERSFKLRHAAVTVCEQIDGTIGVYKKGKKLPYITLAKQRNSLKHAHSKELNTIVDNAVLALSEKAA